MAHHCLQQCGRGRSLLTPVSRYKYQDRRPTDLDMTSKVPTPYNNAATNDDPYELFVYL